MHDSLLKIITSNANAEDTDVMVYARVVGILDADPLALKAVADADLDGKLCAELTRLTVTLEQSAKLALQLRAKIHYAKPRLPQTCMN